MGGGPEPPDVMPDAPSNGVNGRSPMTPSAISCKTFLIWTKLFVAQCLRRTWGIRRPLSLALRYLQL